MEPLPDRADKQIRFGCGFVFGAAIGFLVALKCLFETLGPLLGMAIATGVLCGWLAMRFGDYFWTELLPKMFWWWP